MAEPIKDEQEDQYLRLRGEGAMAKSEAESDDERKALHISIQSKLDYLANTHLAHYTAILDKAAVS